METAKPSLDLVRSLTDEHVLRALMRHRRLTRAELAAETGISKPTAGESVRRLSERGLLVDTGERTPGGRGRGRVGSYYALADTVGTALAVAIAPDGIVAECIDAWGTTITRTHQTISHPARPAAGKTSPGTAEGPSRPAAGKRGPGAAEGPGRKTAAGGGGAKGASPAAKGGEEPDVAGALAAVVAATLLGVPGRPRVAVVSAADPVDRASGRLVQLPDAPFLVGELDAVAVIRNYLDGPVSVDNDVNWAARAEAVQAGGELRDFAYLYLGEGMGCAVVSDGEVQRGRNGLAGEIAYLLTTGPGGRAVRFIDVFGELGLRRPGSSAIDTGRLLSALRDAGAGPVLREALGGVVAAVVALADPGCVVLGGSWGPAVLDGAGVPGDLMPWPVPVRAAELRDEPAFAGARADALHRLRAAITAN